MKQLIFPCLIFLFLHGFGQTAQNENLIYLGGPDITFETDIIDYGTVEQGTDGERIFYFKNTGVKPLVITKCEKTCGCTVPICPAEPIAPGEQGEIKVEYDTKRLGKATKSVKIHTNTEESVITLTIKVNVVKAESDS